MSKPLFDPPLHVGQPNLAGLDRFRERLELILERRWLTNDGPFVREFEAALSERIDVEHCLAVVNGTVALEIAARALGLEGEVIVPAYSFVASAHALEWIGLTPVFCDIDPVTHNIDPASVEGAITPATSAILGVHLWGRPCPIDELQTIADRHGLALFFDAAHALEVSYQGRAVGGYGRCEVFSFHATKFAHAFEGGFVCTRDPELASRVRLLRNFGFAGYDNVVGLGTNGKMSEPSAAMGLTSLEEIDRVVRCNRRNFDAYRSGLESVPGIEILPYDVSQRCNYQYVVLEIDERIFGESRDDLVKRLHAAGVLARRYFYPGIHRMEPYRSRRRPSRPLPHTESVAGRVVVMPTGLAVDPDQIGRICALIARR